MATAASTERATTPIWPRVGEIVLAAVLYFALARGSLFFASINASATPVWPPTGLAIALVLLRGNAMLPAVLAGAFAANFAITPSVLTSALIAMGNSLEALVAAALLNRWAGGRDVFYSPLGIAKFAVIVVAAAAPLSATIGVSSLAATGFAEWSDFVPVWSTWWLGDIGGAVLIAPALILWARGLSDGMGAFTSARVVTLAAALVVGLVAFTPLSPAPRISHAALAFLAILPLMWAGLRLGLRDTAVTALLLCCLAIWGAVSGVGPFLQPTLNQSLLLLVAFIVAVTLPSLALAADRRETQTMLAQTRQELQQAQKMEALGQVTGGVAHDFNNLLMAISSGLRTLERQHDERVKTMQALAHALERGTDLTKQLLAFARREEPNLERVDTAAAVSGALALAERSLTARHAVEARIAAGVWPVRADRAQFEMAILNLVRRTH